MANENKPLNEAKPNEPITAQRWNDMQVALRKEHIEHRHNGTWKDGNYSGEPLAADGLADNAVTTRSIADGEVTPAKLDVDASFRMRALALTGGVGDKMLPIKTPVLSVTGSTFLTGLLRVSLAGKESLGVGDGYIEAGAGGNPLRITSVWSNFTDGAPQNAEIANDTNTYKALMIVGNRSGGGVRKVALWDRVDVMGRLVVGPGIDAGLTVNGNLDATAIQATTLAVTSQASIAALKVGGTVNSGPTTIVGGLSVSEPIVAAKGLRIGPAGMRAANRVQIQGGGLHMDGNPVYLRTDVNDQYDLLRWQPAGDLVELGGFNGVNLGFTKNAANVVAPMVTVRDNNLELGVNANPLRFTSGWSNSPSIATNRSEISNDIGDYKTLMIIGNRSNDPSIRRVSVWDRLEVNGNLAVTGRVTASQYNLQFFQQTVATTNSGAGSRDTYINYAGMGFVQIFAAFAVFNGFSLWNNANNLLFSTWGNAASNGCIPQHAFATVLNHTTNGATIRTFCSESDSNGSGDNTVLATLVVIGRTN